MNKFAWSVVISVLLLQASAQAFSDDAADPLFGNHNALEARIVAPFDVIAADRPTDEEVPGKIYVKAENGEQMAFDVAVRARGEYRLRTGVCAFPPLRLNFKKSQVQNTLFDNQDKLKLVTHCRPRSNIYEQALLAEYLAYRILNIMTDYSFRVRLLEVNYANNEADEGWTNFAFLIEHKDRVAARIAIPVNSASSISVDRLNVPHSSLMSVYQYLIGNTDFAPTAGSAGEDCCHNYTPFGSVEGGYFSIPYDFDMSGIVNAPYASPNPTLRLTSVKDRLYRGVCTHNTQLPNTLKQFRNKRREIEALIQSQTGLFNKSRRSVLKYVGEFYKTISSERSVNRLLIKNCR